MRDDSAAPTATVPARAQLQRRSGHKRHCNRGSTGPRTATTPTRRAQPAALAYLRLPVASPGLTAPSRHAHAGRRAGVADWAELRGEGAPARRRCRVTGARRGGRTGERWAALDAQYPVRSTRCPTDLDRVEGDVGFGGSGGYWRPYVGGTGYMTSHAGAGADDALGRATRLCLCLVQSV